MRRCGGRRSCPPCRIGHHFASEDGVAQRGHRRPQSALAARQHAVALGLLRVGGDQSHRARHLLQQIRAILLLLGVPLLPSVSLTFPSLPHVCILRETGATGGDWRRLRRRSPASRPPARPRARPALAHRAAASPASPPRVPRAAPNAASSVHTHSCIRRKRSPQLHQSYTMGGVAPVVEPGTLSV
jgi:hypothetical protein